MKIYSSRTIYDNELYKFVGKDIWVRVYDNFFHSSKFIRILDIHNYGIEFKFNQITATLIDYSYSKLSAHDYHRLILFEHYKYDIDDLAFKYEMLDKVYIRNVNAFQLVEPLELYFTTEILDIIRENLKDYGED